jgi:hypothetical protein
MGCETPRMEPAPVLDASRPSPLRMWGFLLTVLGALLAGLGALLTWVTVGIGGPGALNTMTKGTDVWEGIVLLGCAVVMLAAVLGSRFVSGAARTVAAGLVTGTSFVAFVVASAFVATADSRFSPIDSSALAQKIADATGATVEQVRATLEQVVQKLGGFTTIGAGPWLAIAGGLLGLAGGVLSLAWASRTGSAASTQEATSEGPADA